MNASHNLATANLAPKIKKPGPELYSANDWGLAKLDLTPFWKLDNFI